MLPLLLENRPSQTDYVLLKEHWEEYMGKRQKSTTDMKQLREIFSTLSFILGDAYVSLFIEDGSDLAVLQPFHAQSM